MYMGLQYVLLEKHMKLKFSDNQKKLQFYLSWSDVLHFLPALSTLTHVHLPPTLHLHLHPRLVLDLQYTSRLPFLFLSWKPRLTIICSCYLYVLRNVLINM